MFELETARNPQTLRRVAIDPLTRVEGHGKVTLLLDEHHRVHQARLHIVEFRGFEAFIEGRPYWEVPVAVQRLCGICPVSHHLAAVKAMDLIAGYGPLTPTAEKLRRLMHYGQILQSHALHFFHLASPDLLLGFDSEPTQRNILGVAQRYPDLAKRGIWLRKFGQEVIRHVSGKRIHGTGAIPGGVNKGLSPAERDEMAKDMGPMLQWAQEAIQMVQEIHGASPDFYNTFGLFDSKLMGLVGQDGALDFYHGDLCVKDADGRLVVDCLPYSEYQGLLDEEVKPWTYMKFPYLKTLGPHQGWYKVGPLARLQTCRFLPSPLAEAERGKWMAMGQGRPVHGTLFFHWARLIELLHAVEVIQSLLEEPDLLGTELMAERGQRRGEAVGVIEAPRGTLFHHYRVDENDLVTYCNLIVSTTHNNQAMNETVRAVARQYLDGHEITEGLLNHIEVAIRAYDPCLSCATHALGKMPLEVDLVDAGGQLIHQARRNFAGTWA